MTVVLVQWRGYELQHTSLMNELSDWLSLYHVTGLGPATYQRLLEQFGSPKNILDCDVTTLQNCGLRNSVINGIKSPDISKVEQDLKWLKDAQNQHIITLNSPEYPSLLKEIPADPPPVLYVKGNLQLLSTPQLAIVGSRNPSASGHENAFNFAKTMTKMGLTITSGLALGIDAASHKGAIAANGPTLAVAATGLDITYPRNHQQLSEEIIEKQGAIVSEHAIGTSPQKKNFPRRNRVISGLSWGTLVVEAALRSGSLITARYAAEQGREVFAIPGSIHTPLSKGCHSLIKQGAKLVESCDDILEELNFINSTTKENSQIFQESPIKPIDLKGDQLVVFHQVGHEPTAVDTVVQRSGLTANVVSSILMELELQRYITSTAGGYYSRER